MTSYADIEPMPAQPATVPGRLRVIYYCYALGAEVVLGLLGYDWQLWATVPMGAYMAWTVLVFVHDTIAHRRFMRELDAWGRRMRTYHITETMMAAGLWTPEQAQFLRIVGSEEWSELR